MELSIDKIYEHFLRCNGVSIDTRTLVKGEMFFALKGPNFDGNKYARRAIDKGATFAVVDDAIVERHDQIIQVSDSLELLQKLARYHRDHLDIPIIGITGSNGKTTTKELLKSVLSYQHKTCATKGNLNNHIGVPLTILNAPEDADILIVEMGSNQPGDIEQLCDISNPDFGLITNIGASHLEKLNSLDGVFDEKTALYSHIKNRNGIFFLNMGDEKLTTLESDYDKIQKYSRDNCSFGTIHFKKEGNPHYLEFEIITDDCKHAIHSQLTGSYNLENIAASLEVGHFFGIALDSIIEVIKSYVPDNMRSQVVNTDRNVIILDAYNANPTSMKASIKGAMDGGLEGLTLILGDMLELGWQSEFLHQEVMDFVNQNDIENVIVVGPELSKASPDKYLKFQNVQKLIASKVLSKISGQTILIKGSRGMKMELAAEHL